MRKMILYAFKSLLQPWKEQDLYRDMCSR